MAKAERGVNRRQFLKGATVAAAGLAVVPSHVLSGPAAARPSEVFTVGIIGCGGQSGEDVNSYIKGWGAEFKVLAVADVDSRRLPGACKRWGEPCQGYTDFRRVMERKDIQIISVATPPHWHAVVACAAAESGKDILCEKPMTKFIAEGRAVVQAVQRYGRVFQIGTSQRFGQYTTPHSRLTRKIMMSGLLKNCTAVYIVNGGMSVKRYCGIVRPQPEPVPQGFDWDFYCGPAPLRPFHRDRFGWNHRFYWDIEGAGLTDLGAHAMDPFCWTYGKDETSPVEIEAYAPPSHPEACWVWGWAEMKFADGLTLVLNGNEWGPRYDRKQSRGVQLGDLDAESQKKLAELPDPERPLTFPEAVRTRRPSGGHAEAAHRAVTNLHLANIAIRMGRKIKYDPIKEQVIGDDEANRLVNQPMRAPWHI